MICNDSNNCDNYGFPLFYKTVVLLFYVNLLLIICHIMSCAHMLFLAARVINKKLSLLSADNHMDSRWQPDAQQTSS